MVILSAQHKANVDIEKLRIDITNKVILPSLPPNLIDSNTKIMVNPTGRFVVGGSKTDSRLTGRKIIVDTYGWYAKHGGCAFSRKAPSKVDRSAAYVARYAAKNIVASGLADKCEIQISYTIGVADPISINVNTSGTGKQTDEKLSQLVKEKFDFRPSVIINKINLKRSIYK